ncbi:hypothetical protein GCM10027184_17810 [Saccharothrix stipae]
MLEVLPGAPPQQAGRGSQRPVHLPRLRLTHDRARTRTTGLISYDRTEPSTTDQTKRHRTEHTSTYDQTWALTPTAGVAPSPR